MNTSKALRSQVAFKWHTTSNLLLRDKRSIRPISQLAISKMSDPASTRVGAVDSATRTYTTTTSPKPPFFPDSSSATTAGAASRAASGSKISTSPKPPFFPESAQDPYATVKEPLIHDIFEPVTGTWQYIVVDPQTFVAAIIDPVLDYDPVTQVVSTTSADKLLALVKEKGYEIERLLETHAHADHLTASSYLQARLAETQGYKPPIGIGRRIGQVQDLFAKKYAVDHKEVENVFDRLFDDDEDFAIGSMKVTAIHLPGHTPDHLGYRIGDNVFCGDSLFAADLGTARCDFPGGSATDLYNTSQKLLQLPPQVKIWTGHDYPPKERSEPVPCQTVQEHKERNKHVRDGVTKEEFVEMRIKRDSGLGAPRLLHQSLQVNIRAGRMPGESEGGYRLLHLPLKLGELEGKF